MISCKYAALSVFLLGLAGGLLWAQEQPKIREEVVVRWWLVPVYATKDDGSPARGLKADDFEVYLNKKKIPLFNLHKKEFQAVEPYEGPPFEGVAPAFEKKMVFLVFDSAFSSYALLEKAKKVAGTMMAQEGQGAQFIALSIEPFSGLKTILGPTRDHRLVARTIDEFVSGKKADYLRSNVMDSTSIRNVYPSGLGRNPDELPTPGRWTNVLERLDTAEKRRIASVYTRSLLTLNLILNYFRDNSKVIYLFSCGIPASAMEWKKEILFDPTGPAEPGDGAYLNITPDHFNRQALVDVARFFNRNGSLLFLINPAGTRLAGHDQESGEQALRILADESGGRYYGGPERDIAREIAGMESAYYEISFPDSDEFQGPDMDLEIRPKKAGFEITTVRRVSRDKGYGQMSRLEREILVLNLLDHGHYAQAKLRVVDAEFRRLGSGGKTLSFVVRLPGGPGQSEWDVFKVWREAGAGKIMMEKEQLLSESPELKVAMKQRKGFRHELVLVSGRTGTTLVYQE